MIDISTKHLNIVLAILDEYVPEYEIRIFGSSCTGKAKPYSDLDIALVGRENLDWNAISSEH
jgi:uncharacterized protein